MRDLQDAVSTEEQRLLPVPECAVGWVPVDATPALALCTIAFLVLTVAVAGAEPRALLDL